MCRASSMLIVGRCLVGRYYGQGVNQAGVVVGGDMGSRMSTPLSPASITARRSAPVSSSHWAVARAVALSASTELDDPTRFIRVRGDHAITLTACPDTTTIVGTTEDTSATSARIIKPPHPPEGTAEPDSRGGARQGTRRKPGCNSRTAGAGNWAHVTSSAGNDLPGCHHREGERTARPDNPCGRDSGLGEGTMGY